MGGGNQSRKSSFALMMGLSPRGRGKQNLARLQFTRDRSIPAWAGETAIHRLTQPAAVYPRVGGGNSSSGMQRRCRKGLSPRGRGKRLRWRRLGANCRSIPAWAGETHSQLARGTSSKVYPRVGGGNVALVRGEFGTEGLSPRGRGKRHQYRYCVDRARSIPAWAGETAAHWAAHWAAQVYPRVGGGNYSLAGDARKWRGLSPRGRGKR